MIPNSENWQIKQKQQQITQLQSLVNEKTKEKTSLDDYFTSNDQHVLGRFELYSEGESLLPNQSSQDSKVSISEANNDVSKSVEDVSDQYITVKSPIIGTFYRKPSPDKDPFVSVGDKIEEGTVIAIVEAMKLFNEIESEVSGTIIKVLIDDMSPVEYDQPLFLVDPNK